MYFCSSSGFWRAAALTEESTEATGLKVEIGYSNYSDVSVTFKVSLSIDGYSARRSEFE